MHPSQRHVPKKFDPVTMRRLVNKVPSDSCAVCDCSIELDEHEVSNCYVIGGEDHKGVTWIHQCCAVCFVMDVAIQEAKSEGRRYTPVGVYPNPMFRYGGEKHRCLCGAATHSGLGFCPTCAREHRMLGKEMANARFNRKLIQQLKEQLNGKQRKDDRRAA